LKRPAAWKTAFKCGVCASCTLWWSSIACGQFVDVSEILSLPTEHYGGYLGEGLSFADFNGDYIDDLSFASHDGELKFFVGTGDESGFEAIDLPLTFYPEEAKMVLWCDIDNDGDQDLFVTYRNAPNKMYLSNGQGNFQDISAFCGIQQNDKKSYGACFGDFDLDGLNDLFVCHYSSDVDEEPLNELYRNLGGGMFEDITSDSEDFTVPNLQSFQSQWADLNGDGLLDIYVVRDRPIHPNYYFVQSDENIGVFEDQAEERGLDIAINCMTTSMADFDRDADLDVFLTAFPIDSNWLMINYDGYFSTLDSLTGEVPQEALQNDGVSWAGNWLDVDCDGWEDLHVTTGFDVFTYYPSVLDMFPDEPDHLHYNSEGSFLDEDNELDETSVLSFSTAVGDYNYDGYPDIVSHSVGDIAHVLKGTPNGNHWLKIWLEGETTNRDGTGCEITVFTDEALQYRVTFAGENYLGQNSRWEHFGLGTYQSVDSIQVDWLSGGSTTYYGVETNHHLLIHESEGMEVLVALDPAASGCTYAMACNYNAAAVQDDGSCDFECAWNSMVCGEGTVWDGTMAMCVPAASCLGDFNGDDAVTVEDLLLLLNNFFSPCP